VESYSRRTGARLALAIAEPNTGDFLIKLKTKRNRDENEVISDLRSRIKKVQPVIDLDFPHILEDLIGDLVSSPEPVEIKVFHPDENTFKKVTADIADWLPKVHGIVDVNDRTVVVGPSINFKVNLPKAQRAGFGVNDVAAIESTILDGDLASNMIRDNRLIGIRVRYPLEYRSSVEKLKALLMTSPTGITVPLSSIADMQVEEGVTEIHRDNLRNMSSVTARFEKRDLGSRNRYRIWRALSDSAGVLRFAGAGSSRLHPAHLHHPDFRVPILLAPDRDFNCYFALHIWGDGRPFHCWPNTEHLLFDGSHHGNRNRPQEWHSHAGLRAALF
jgi:Cu/Ag efflux pump CusA